MTDENYRKAFWFVWRPNGYAPNFLHDSEQSAIAECERLAIANPGTEFIVLQSVLARKVDKMQRVTFHPLCDIPF